MQLLRFQSSSGQKAGCNRRSASTCRHNTSSRFNPHPARRPDATVAMAEVVARSWPICFNPHPARRPDATSGLCTVRQRSPMFQSSSGQKAGCNVSNAYPRVRIQVSILIRPEGRMQRRLHAVHRPQLLRMFQSSSGQKAGCNPCTLELLVQIRGSFNPHPARRPDATSTHDRMYPRTACVSILIRPEGRMQQPVYPSAKGVYPQRFNPHPARRPDATWV